MRPFEKEKYLREQGLDSLQTTEVGMCEMAVLIKHNYRIGFLLAACCGMDVDRASVQPQVDVFIIPPGDAAKGQPR